MPIALKWYCAQLQRHHEADAFAHLRRLGFDALIPLTPVERRHARRVRVVLAPMLPGYGFVRLDTARPGWQRVWRAPYVVRIIAATPEAPEAVPDRIIRGLMALPKGGDPRPLLIPEGATVAFSEGAWSDHRGICILSEERRWQIAVQIFGRQTVLTVTDPNSLRIVSLGA